MKKKKRKDRDEQLVKLVDHIAAQWKHVLNHMGKKEIIFNRMKLII